MKGHKEHRISSPLIQAKRDSGHPFVQFDDDPGGIVRPLAQVRVAAAVNAKRSQYGSDHSVVTCISARENINFILTRRKKKVHQRI